MSDQATTPTTDGPNTTETGTTEVTPVTAAPETPAVPEQASQQEAKPTEAPKPETPAEYADFTAPDGVTLDPELTTEFKGIAKELGLTQDKAQALADIGVKLGQKFQQAQIDFHQKTMKEWADQARADKEIGGEKLAENLAIAEKALDQFGSPELKALLIHTGLANHPDMIKAFHRIGQAISDDSFVTSRQSTAGGKPESLTEQAAKAFYKM